MLKNLQKERVAIYIDGSNFYNRLKEIGVLDGFEFDYKKFAEHLSRGRNLISKRYYVGVVRNTDGSKKSEQLVSGQQKFLKGLENEDYAIKRGKVIYSFGHTREKGVDVKIAADLIIGAIDNIYDTAILVSSDTDLIPALNYVRYKNKGIEYVGFSHNPSFGLIKNSTKSILLLPEDLQQFKK
ncbi:MAG: NYN domain-containing protein [bacterium]|nr:NYN domain-containing protein [bacterium]